MEMTKQQKIEDDVKRQEQLQEEKMARKQKAEEKTRAKRPPLMPARPCRERVGARTDQKARGRRRFPAGGRGCKARKTGAPPPA